MTAWARRAGLGRRGRAGALLLALVLPAAGAAAGDPGADLARAGQLHRGWALAKAHCAACHAVGLSEESPAWVTSNAAFRDLHTRFPIPMLEEAQRTGEIPGHDEMPAFAFAPEDAAALLAYIDSLAPDAPGYGAQAMTDDIAAGRALATRLCARCHLNPGQGEKSGPAGIPGFVAVARRPGQSLEGIVRWLESVPPMMPNHRLTRDEMFRLAAFILSLRGAE